MEVNLYKDRGKVEVLDWKEKRFRTKIEDIFQSIEKKRPDDAIQLMVDIYNRERRAFFVLWCDTRQKGFCVWCQRLFDASCLKIASVEGERYSDASSKSQMKKFEEVMVLCEGCLREVRSSKDSKDRPWSVTELQSFYGYQETKNGNARRLQAKILFAAPQPPEAAFRLGWRNMPPRIYWGPYRRDEVLVEIQDNP